MADQVNPTGNQDPSQSLGWRAGLPDNLKNNETLSAFKTVGELGNAHIETLGKVKEYEGKLANAVIKPGEKATESEKAAYYKALGRPDKPDEYEFPEGDGVKHSADMVNWARGTFHQANLTKEQGVMMTKAWDSLLQGMVKADGERRAKAKTDAEAKLKTELGDKYDGAIELAGRFWKKHTDQEFTDFLQETRHEGEAIGNDPQMIKFVIKVAQLLGEDVSPTGAVTRRPGGKGADLMYEKSPKPPPKT